MSDTPAQELLREGIAAARSGDRPAARRAFLGAVADDGGAEAAWMWLASLAESPAEALGHLERVLALSPNHARAAAAARSARLQAGIAAAQAGDKLRARALLRRVVGDDSDCEPAWLWLASVAATPDDGVVALEHVLRINPHNARAADSLRRHRERVAGPAPAAPPAADAAPVERPTPPPRTVLVADGNDDVRRQVAKVLQRHGYQVLTAADGYEAVTMLRENGVPALALLDDALPGLDGYHLCRLLRQDAATEALPVLLTSGRDGFFGKVRARLCGATDLLNKPFDADGLVAAVTRLCPAVPPLE